MDFPPVIVRSLIQTAWMCIGTNELTNVMVIWLADYRCSTDEWNDVAIF